MASGVTKSFPAILTICRLPRPASRRSAAGLRASAKTVGMRLRGARAAGGKGCRGRSRLVGPSQPSLPEGTTARVFHAPRHLLRASRQGRVPDRIDTVPSAFSATTDGYGELPPHHRRGTGALRRTSLPSCFSCAARAKCKRAAEASAASAARNEKAHAGSLFVQNAIPPSSTRDKISASATAKVSALLGASAAASRK